MMNDIRPGGRGQKAEPRSAEAEQVHARMGPAQMSAEIRLGVRRLDAALHLRNYSRASMGPGSRERANGRIAGPDRGLRCSFNRAGEKNVSARNKYKGWKRNQRQAAGHRRFPWMGRRLIT